MGMRDASTLRCVYVSATGQQRRRRRRTSEESRRGRWRRRRRCCWGACMRGGGVVHVRRGHEREVPVDRVLREEPRLDRLEPLAALRRRVASEHSTHNKSPSEPAHWESHHNELMGKRKKKKDVRRKTTRMSAADEGFFKCTFSSERSRKKRKKKNLFYGRVPFPLPSYSCVRAGSSLPFAPLLVRYLKRNARSHCTSACLTCSRPSGMPCRRNSASLIAASGTPR